MATEDRMLTCRDCGTEFAFTAGEQDFYSQKGFEHEPSRCINCRQARKRERSSAGGPDRLMYDAVCSQCGVATQVPFSPRPDKPVYCADCYRSVAGRRARV
ncbi:MAG: zinc-ribbon domain containing protein [Candidatus Eremiobacteraeota bacterium]|nr:zinc-ribbon domain containing protein [Candidatus Eremiobacteraeota bacterium]